MKYLNVNFEMNTMCKYSFREENDKKGGGVMILYRNNTDVEIQQVVSGHADILHVSCNFKKFCFAMVVVYFDTKDINRNNELIRIIDDIIDKETQDQKPLLLLGDFNAHIGLVGSQAVNANGNVVLDMMEKHNLALLNADLNCIGETTWGRGDQKSAIDFVFCNQPMYETFRDLYIDEEGNIFDLSDHNILIASFEIKVKRTNRVYSDQYKEITYLK